MVFPAFHSYKWLLCILVKDCLDDIEVISTGEKNDSFSPFLKPADKSGPQKGSHAFRNSASGSRRGVEDSSRPVRSL